MISEIFNYLRYGLSTLIVFPIVFILIVFINMFKECILQKQKKLK